MIKETNQKDPRYYYIRIIDLKINSYKDLKFKTERIHLKFHLGTKYSDTIFSINDFKDEQKKKRITQEAHIFKYGGQQFLNIYIQEYSESKTNENQNNNKKQTVSGYTRILLPALIEYPHICHQIKASFISVKNKIQFTKDFFAELTFQLFYRLDFRGKIDIIPISANLERNVAQFGQMKPYVQLSLGGQSWRSLEAEGIHPRWSGHFHTKKQKAQLRKGHYHIKNLRDNILLNSSSIQERKLFHAENMTTRQEYFDIASFSLCSAGSFLTIKIYSSPFIGKSPDLVGQAQIRISNVGFFRHPSSLQQNNFAEKEIKLYVREQQQKVIVGNFTFLTRFIFDQNQVLNQGPYIEQMPKPRIQLQTGKNNGFH